MGLPLGLGAGQRLFAQHHLAGLGGGDGDFRMQVVRHADIDGVDVLARDQRAPVALDAFIAPHLREAPHLAGVARRDRLENRAIAGVEEMADIGPGIGMGAGHEAIADHADIESFGHDRSPYSRQPWASRTLIMAPKTLFQVDCCSITELGNMQPSQQMWRIVLVSSPLPSRSQ